MCGFAVTIWRGPAHRTRLATAIETLNHRGPDAQGFAYITLPGTGDSVSVEAGLAHARLSILDLDARSNQPFRHGRHAIVYNGEIYNYSELASGMSLATSGDTEVLLRLLIRDGLAALEGANGMWAFCWLDEANQRLTAGRDRYGKKPLFYAIEADAIHLASEPQAVAALLGRPLAMNASAIDRFMADGWLFPDPSGATHLEAIHEVPPGHALTFDIRNWTIDVHKAFPLRFDEGSHGQFLSDEALAEVAADAIRSRLISDRKVGLFLSGGVDSTLILSVLSALDLTENVICITGDAGRTDDARYARACIEQLGITALNVPLPYDSLGFEQFLAMCQSQAKPFPLIGNVLGMHALYKAVAEHDIRVVLDGTGADEIFGGYWHRYFAAALRDAQAADDQDWIDAVKPIMPNSYRHLHAANGWMSTREFPGLDDLAMLRSDARRTMAATAPQDPLHDHMGTLSETLLCDASAGRMQEWLWQNDRNAMASSVENRSPFLDHRLAAWAMTPYHRKFGGLWNKKELRSLFGRFVPLPTAERRDKQGFRWAFDHFFRGNLESLLALIAGSAAAREYVDTGVFADAVRSGRIGLDSRLLHRLSVIGGLEAAGYRFSRA
jgi:asparagine synthase (glutamine-hydrolysing)